MAGISPAPSLAFDLAPAAGAVVGDDLAEHRQQGTLVDRLVATHGDRPPCLVPVTAGDDAFRVRHDAAVVQEDVDVVLRGEQRADVAVEHEVRLDRPLDRLLDRGVRLMDEIAHPLADLLLPVRAARSM